MKNNLAFVTISGTLGINKSPIWLRLSYFFYPVVNETEERTCKLSSASKIGD